MLAARADHFQLPCHEEQKRRPTEGYNPAGANKFPVTWTAKQTAPARGLKSQGQRSGSAYLVLRSSITDIPRNSFHCPFGSRFFVLRCGIAISAAGFSPIKVLGGTATLP